MNFRHGDVIIEKTADDAPRGAPRPRDARGHVLLAEGTATGHGHRITSTGVALFDAPESGGGRILAVREMATLSHEEHATITIPPGTYTVRIKRLYDPEGAWAPVED